MGLALYWISTVAVFGSVIWICWHAWTNDKILWAIGSFFCGILAIAYGAVNWDELKVPTIVVSIAILLNIGSRFMLVNS